MNVVICGARERRDSDDDKKVVESLLKDLIKQHGTRLHVLSVGCDKGVGKYVRDFCINNRVKFVEVRMKFEGEEIERSFFAHMFLARNTALLQVGDIYHIFTGTNPNGIIEALVPPAKERVGQERVATYEM